MPLRQDNRTTFPGEPKWRFQFLTNLLSFALRAFISVRDCGRVSLMTSLLTNSKLYLENDKNLWMPLVENFVTLHESSD